MDKKREICPDDYAGPEESYIDTWYHPDGNLQWLVAREIDGERVQETWVYYEREFINRNCPGSGYLFPCDANGEILPLYPAGQQNYNACINGELDVVDHGVIKRVVHDVHWLCRCGCGKRGERQYDRHGISIGHWYDDHWKGTYRDDDYDPAEYGERIDPLD